MAHFSPLVVIADDEQAIVMMLCELLADEGFDVIACFSAEEAYNLIVERKPSLAIVDLQMERLDSGISLVQRMRLNPETASIPAIVISADGSRLKALQSQLESHGCHVLAKPFNLQELIEKMHSSVAAHAAQEAGDGVILPASAPADWERAISA